MRLHGVIHSLIFFLMACGLSASLQAATTEPADLAQLASAGTRLDKEHAERMESMLLAAPADAGARAQLLGYYSLRPSDEPKKRGAHILWIIQNDPADPFSGSAYCHIDSETEGYPAARALWLRQQSADPDNLMLLQNAVHFLLPADDAEAERLLQHAIDLQPKMAEWREQLAKLFELREAKYPDDAAKFAAAALQQRQDACDLTRDPHYRFAVFIPMPRDAFVAHDTIRAKQLARQLLGWSESYRDDPNYGLAIHVGNIVMGRIALHGGDVDTASSYLLAAGQAPPSPQLEANGPDMTLAKELLKRADRQIIHNYLQNCTKIWTSGAARLKAWMATVDSGGTPDFGAMAIE